MSADWPIPAYPPEPIAGTKADGRVAVVGAGAAGLMTARMLVAAGFDVTVLEASDRPGGRVHTLREPFVNGQHVEAGACFVPDVHSYTIGVAKDLGLELVPLRHYTDTTDLDVLEGTRIPHPESATEWPVGLRADEPNTLEGLQAYLNKGLEAVSSGPDPRLPEWPPKELDWLDRMSLQEYLVDQGASSAAIEILRLGYLDLWGEGIDSVSALMLFRDMAMMSVTPPEAEGAAATQPGRARSMHAAHPAAKRLGGRRTRSETTRAEEHSELPPYTTEQGLGGQIQYNVRGGADQITSGMATALGPRVLYGRRVVGVIRGEQVRLVCEDGSDLAADHVVIALPTSVLRRIDFSPPLSPEKANAISALGETSVTRVYLQFGKRYYLYDGLAGTANTDLPQVDGRWSAPGAWLFNQTNTQDSREGIIDVYCVGANARRLCGLPEEQRIEAGLSIVERAFPGARANFNGKATSWCWDADTFELAGYPYFKSGQLTNFLSELRRSEDRIHFAGDHTSALPGWIQGALESGERAAREVRPPAENGEGS